jgi:UDPglucose 6-dehydrogenase
MDINRDQRALIVSKLREHLGSLEGRTIGLLGLAFKPGTDDLREAPSLEIAKMLVDAGAEVSAYDPVAVPAAKRLLPQLIYRRTPYSVARGADAIVLVTEWNEFKELDFDRLRRAMRRPVLIDGRNIFEPARMRALGFAYSSIGRR